MQDDNNYYTQPNGSQYGQSNQPDGYSPYGQPNQQYGYPPYGQPGQPNGSQYGQPNQPNGYLPYGQPNQQYGYPPYGQQYQLGMGYGMDIAPFDQNGRPIPNRFGMKLTFSILEMVLCNILSLICGIIGCVFTVKANTAYKERRWEDFKNHAKASAIALWIGFGLGMLTFFVYIILFFGIQGLAGSVDAGNGEIYVYVDGTRIDIPTDYDEMTDLGFYLSRGDGSGKLEGGDYTICKMYNSKNEQVMWCWFYNAGISTRDVTDCQIIGVNVDNYSCDNYESYRTSEGLGFQSSVQDFWEAYGAPDDVSATYNGIKYYWYLGDKDDHLWRVIEVTFEDDELYEIDIDYKK